MSLLSQGYKSTTWHPKSRDDSESKKNDKTFEDIENVSNFSA